MNEQIKDNWFIYALAALVPVLMCAMVWINL